MFLLLESIEAHFLGISGTQFKKRKLVSSDRDTELYSLNLNVGLERRNTTKT